MRGIIIDTGAIVAISNDKDDWHARIKKFLGENLEPLIAPVTVLPEACYLINKYLGAYAESRFIDSCFSGDPKVEMLVQEDFLRSFQFMQHFLKANIGFVDASVAAVAERLKINRILTTDRRHFSLFRPSHCGHFTLLP